MTACQSTIFQRPKFDLEEGRLLLMVTLILDSHRGALVMWRLQDKSLCMILLKHQVLDVQRFEQTISIDSPRSSIPLGRLFRVNQVPSHLKVTPPPTDRPTSILLSSAVSGTCLELRLPLPQSSRLHLEPHMHLPQVNFWIVPSAYSCAWPQRFPPRLQYPLVSIDDRTLHVCVSQQHRL